VEEKYIGMLDYIMSTNELRAPVFGNNNPLKFTDRPVAAKTGTTNEWRDGWTVGYTPSLAVGVWAGNNDNSPMAQGADGIYVAAPIWRNFMDQVLKNYNMEQFPKYEKEETGKPALDGTLKIKEELRVCKFPGKKNSFCLANDTCPESQVEKKDFFSAHDILWYVKKEDPRGDAPKNPGSDPQFKNWESAVQKWAEKSKDFNNDTPPDRDCKSSDFESFKPSVSISSPSEGDTIIASSFTIKASASSEFGIKKTSVSINGSEVFSGDSSGINYSYSVPDDKKTATLDIKVAVTDKADNDDSSSVTVHTLIP
jgi:membrane peptidoglycan carboxypeptidase